MLNDLPFSHSQPRVLVIDDMPSNLDVVIENLSREPVEIQVALSGREGLELARRVRPDLILLDVMMPDMDGYEVCRELKSDRDLTDVPVVFLSARGEEQEVEQGLLLGAVDYIQKPFSAAILRARIKTHLAHKQRLDHLQGLACIDALTACANRRNFDERMRVEWQRAIQNRHPLSLIMIDVDYFKPFNDHYGHGAGDQCLRRVADLLRQQLQAPADLLARYGGEEFIVLLPDTAALASAVVAQHMCSAVHSAAIPHARSAIADCVTVSLGVASAEPVDDMSESSLLAEVDQWLYRAKNEGRNRVAGSAL